MLCNAYGPTEVTIVATAAVLVGVTYGAGELVTIGPALRGVRTLVVDPDNREVDDGEPGELLLGGDQLALGVPNRPELTAEKFVVDPTGRTTDRYYRTGDRVRRLPDDAFVFEGACVDDQVKIRGYRFELGEIEAAFAADVKRARSSGVARADRRRRVDHRARRAPRGGTTPLSTSSAVAATLLPSYAMPALIERRTSIPLVDTGRQARSLRRGTRGPLGFAEEQQWFLHKLDPTSPAYNLATAVSAAGTPRPRPFFTTP